MHRLPGMHRACMQLLKVSTMRSSDVVHVQPAQTTLQAPDDFRLPSCMAATGAHTTYAAVCACSRAHMRHAACEGSKHSAPYRTPGGAMPPPLFLIFQVHSWQLATHPGHSTAPGSNG